MIPYNKSQYYVGQLTADDAAKIYVKSGTLLLVGGAIGFYLIYKLLIQK